MQSFISDAKEGKQVKGIFTFDEYERSQTDASIKYDAILVLGAA